LIQIESSELSDDSTIEPPTAQIDWTQAIHVVLPEHSPIGDQITALAKSQPDHRLVLPHMLCRMLEEQLRAAQVPQPGSAARAETTTEALSKREWDVLQLIEQGLPNQGIAQALTITLNTVKMHIQHIYSKLRVSNRTQAVAQIWHFPEMAQPIIQKTPI
jgi:ATP/maltotriose-dependent transcriptional regulator MalT